MRVVAVRAECPHDVIWLDEAPRNEVPVKAKQKVHAWYNKIGRNTTKRGTSKIEKDAHAWCNTLRRNTAKRGTGKSEKKARAGYPITSSSGPRPPAIQCWRCACRRWCAQHTSSTLSCWGTGGGGGWKRASCKHVRAFVSLLPVSASWCFEGLCCSYKNKRNPWNPWNPWWNPIQKTTKSWNPIIFL